MTAANRDAERNDRPGAAPRSRPAFLRALGRDDPPAEVTVDGVTYLREEIYKHDSWAATGVYRAARPDAAAPKIICKFNRRQSLLGLPAAWIGRALARRESGFLRRLADVPFVPRVLGAVVVDGAVQPNAMARVFIEGHPLGDRERVGNRFFADLGAALCMIHEHDVAYVDLHKRENVLVGDDGLPYLIDFQVAIGLSSSRFGRSWPMRRAVAMMQRMDLHCRVKLYRRCRPDQCSLTAGELAASRPWFIRVHRAVAQPLRNLRRRLLVALGVRSGRGKVETERFVEAGLREPPSRAA